ncbi:MAG: nicotinate-nucleotide pyrophosphorylase (carboxylating) [Actinomycetia bacterium]|nr:nicotinate-nucleotide pyrophosphorylase (carboxylating) [Actinomycetes bacterium]
MSDFDPPVTTVRDVVSRALTEDLGVLGDLTSLAVIPESAGGGGWFVARRSGVLAGTLAASEVFTQLDPSVDLVWAFADGDRLEAGARIGRIDGPLRAVLAGERSALNLLGHCSGIATLTRSFVDAAGEHTRIRDTRKTLPGLRALEKAAVRAGGGANHRECLSDAVLIKDNHLAFASLGRAVELSRARWPGRVIEVECDSLEQVAEAKLAAPDLVLLDNMSPDLVRESIAVLGGSAPVEVSGRVELASVPDYVAAGADYIAVGALTHSAPVFDIGLDLELAGKA